MDTFSIHSIEKAEIKGKLSKEAIALKNLYNTYAFSMDSVKQEEFEKTSLLKSMPAKVWSFEQTYAFSQFLFFRCAQARKYLTKVSY